MSVKKEKAVKKERTGFQIIDINTGMYINCKADRLPHQLIFSKDGRFFTEAAAKNYKYHTIKALSRHYGGIELVPIDVIAKTLEYLKGLRIVEVKVQVLHIVNDFDLSKVLKD